MTDHTSDPPRQQPVTGQTDDLELFRGFKKSQDTLWVCRDGNAFFKTGETGLMPLMHYLEQYPEPPQDVTVCDRIVGNAAALLLKKAHYRRVYGVLGSELARKTLARLGIACSLDTVIPHIINKTGTDMCPMERLSLGKEPDEFYLILKERFRNSPK